MSDTGPTSPVRPMAPCDYSQGDTLPAQVIAHPMRDLFMGAVVGAVALWVVPRVLDLATDYFTQGDDNLELEDA